MVNHPNRSRRALIEQKVEAELSREEQNTIKRYEDYIADRGREIEALALEIGRLAIDRDNFVKALKSLRAQMMQSVDPFS